jgi:AraC family transcriptional regulator
VHTLSSIRLEEPNTAKQADIVPARNVLWSSGTAWQGVTAEAYRFPDLDTPEFQTLDHNLVVHMSCPARISLKANDKFDSRIRVIGDLSIFPAGTVCQVRSSEPHEVMVVSISQQLVARAGFDMGRMPPFEPVLSPYLRDPHIEHICWALRAEAESRYGSGTLYGESLGVALATRLLGGHSTKNPSSGQRGGMAPRVLRRVIDYIDSNLGSSLSLSCLADIAGLSAYRFAHNFKSVMGLPPHQYVLRARIARARQILRETDLSVLEIANTVGCQSLSRFHSLFKRETGTVPRAYRALFRSR